MTPVAWGGRDHPPGGLSDFRNPDSDNSDKVDAFRQHPDYKKLTESLTTRLAEGRDQALSLGRGTGRVAPFCLSGPLEGQIEA